MSIPKPAVIAPIVHLNGDTAATLIDGLRQSSRAIQAAMRVMRDNGPHARNYDVKPGTFEQAVAQHKRRIALLADVCEELLAEMDLIEWQKRS